MNQGSRARHGRREGWRSDSDWRGRHGRSHNHPAVTKLDLIAHSDRLWRRSDPLTLNKHAVRGAEILSGEATPGPAQRVHHDHPRVFGSDIRRRDARYRLIPSNGIRVLPAGLVRTRTTCVSRPWFSH